MQSFNGIGNPIKPINRLLQRKKYPECGECGRKADLFFEAMLKDLNKPFTDPKSILRQIKYICYDCFGDAETAFEMGKSINQKWGRKIV